MNERYADKGVDFVLFATGSGMFAEHGKPWVKVSSEEEVRRTAEYYTVKQGLTNLVAVDSARFPSDTAAPQHALDARFAQTYKFKGFPWVVILDRHGVMRARLIFDEDQIDSIISKLLTATL